MKREALSRDGYIVDQRRTDDLPYSRRMSSENGCGWIAVYNLLRLLGCDEDPDALRCAMARCAPLGGRFGTWPLRLRRFLKKRLRERGFGLSCAWRLRAAVRRSADCRGGVVLYCHAYGPHYVAFAPASDGEGRLRFFNAVAGEENDVTDMERFLHRERAFPFQLVLLVQ